MAPRPQSTLLESDDSTTEAIDNNTSIHVNMVNSNGLSGKDGLVVISGISGRFPESDSVDEFAHNLFNKVDMITEDNRRWPTDLYEMNQRMGKLNEIDKFDGAFFGWRNRLGDSVDPQARIILETTYEAICDSGINPQSLRGSRTGVYVGNSTIGMPDGFPTVVDPTSRTSLTEGMSWVQGTSKSMYANRVSFFFDFRGPSMTIDTACSSSMVALDIAVTDIRCGKCDQAIVAGVNINLQAFTNYFYQKLGFNAPDGISKVWDIEADGFVRGETVASLFLQRECDSKRIYARIINSRTNIDGYKKTGMFFPSSDGQRDLLVDTYKEVNVNPNDITYFEAHGTGTKAGDFQEAYAIHRAYCISGRTKPLPIGLLKSNIGHGEAASGVASITKLIISFENECIPANLNLKSIKPNIAELKLLKPITESHPYVPGIAGVNSFGVGGVNGHALLEPNYQVCKEESNEIASQNLPRLVLLHGRTKEAVEYLMNFIENNPNKVTSDFLGLIADVFKYKPMLNSAGFPYRGTMLLKKKNSSTNLNSLSYHRSDIQSINIQFRNQLCFFYSGIGGQAAAMAKEFMHIEIFSSKLFKLSSVLKPYGINLVELLANESSEAFINDSLTAKFVSTTAFQVIFTDILTEDLEIIPEIIVGHSFGEIAAAYAQGFISAEEAVLISYNRGMALEQARKNIPSGLMAAVGLSFDEAIDMCPKNVYVACNNAPKLVTISGEKKATKKFLEKLKAEGVFVRELDSAKYPLHTPFLEVVKDQLIERLDAVFMASRGKTTKNVAKDRNLKWISTAQTQDFMDELYSNRIDDNFHNRMSQYFLNNLLNPVNFNGVLSRIPDSSIILEISGHELFEKVIATAKPSLKYLPLLRGKARSPETIMGTFSALYRLGFNPSVERFYPAVKWPVVRGTQSISSLLKWDHKETYFVKLYPEYGFKATASDLLLEIDPENPEFEYLYHHVIDGKHILPGSAMLFFAWKRYSDSRSKSWTKLPVQFEDVQLRRPIFLDKNQKITLKVRLLDPSGEFIILEGPNVVCTGVIKELKPDSFEHQEMLDKYDEMVESMSTVTMDDIYKDFHVRGYEYGPKFRCIVDYSTDIKHHSFANVRWIGHMTAFLDNLLQLSAPVSPIKELIVPVIFPLVKCDPNIFFEAIQQNNITSSEVKENPDVNELIGDVDDAQIDAEEMDEMRSKMSKITGEADQVKNADSIIRAYLNGDSRAIVAPGIEILNFCGAYIGRKVHPQPVATESHQFVPHNESRIVHEGKELEMFEYEKICAIECSHLLGQFKLNKLCSIVMNGFAKEIDQSVKDKYSNAKDGNSLLKILSLSVADLADDPNNNSKVISEDISFSEMEYFGNFSALLCDSSFQLSNKGLKDKDIIDELLQKRYLLNYLHSDSVAALSHEERLIRPLIDVVAENFTFSKEFTVLQLSPVQMYPLSFSVDKYLAASSVFKLNIDYTVAHPLADQSEEEIPYNFTNLSWNIQQEQLWPSNVQLKQQPHLIVLFDEPLQQELQVDTEDFWLKLNNSLLQTGFVLALFRTKFSPVERLVYETILKVKMPTDQELLERIDVVKRKASTVDLLIVATKSDNFGHCSILFRKNQAAEKATYKTVIFERDEDTWLQTVQDNLKIASNGGEERIWILADGDTLPGSMGFFNCIRKEPGGRLFRLLYLAEGVNGSIVELFEKHKQTLIELDLSVNIYKGDAFGTYRHLSCNLLNATRVSEEYHLNLGIVSRKDLGSLTLYDSTHLNQLTYIPELGAKLRDRKYAVYSSALNFRDVMLASGRIFPPINLLTQNCPLGTEFAGRDVETGTRVFGISQGGSFASSIWVDPVYVRPIPEHWSYDDAVGTVTTYFTVWYGLIHKAQLEPGSTVLIHSAAGGVGQAALYLCKAYGCTIYATAGSEDKRKFVQEHFQIPSERIFSSRDCLFEREIRRLTNGKGVKYILNSLIGEQLDSSLRLVADNGHFIELAKFEMQMNKKIGTFPFLRNLTYHGVAIEQPIWKEKHTVSKFFDWLLTNCGPNQSVQPISSHVFTLENAVAAFRFMTTGKHKGKIIIRVRENDPEQNGNTISPCKPLKVQTRTYFSPLKSYIVIGGCGGVGLELAHWLVRKGAKRIVLTSRSAQRTPYQSVSLGCLNASGDHFAHYTNQISVYNKDISTEEGIRQLIIDAEQIAPIGGIFHLAVSLNDCLFENMTPELWHKTVDSKGTSALLMDKVTRKMCPNLDYFVCFSSVSAGRGNVGQTNYGYANSVLDRICERRRNDGLHGVSVQYGPIGDVGLLSDMNDRSAFASVRLQRIMSCLDILNRAIQSEYAVVSSLVFVDRSQQENAVNGDSMLQHLWSALGVDPETLPDHVTLGELGMESMFAIEMQQTLEQEFNVRLSLQEIKLITVGELKSSSKEKLQEQLSRVREFKSYLLTVNLSLPQTSTEPLNSVTDGEPIFLLPSVLGIFGGMRVFAEKVNYPMIALNITREVNNKYTCIKTASEYFMSLLREMYPNIKRYNLVGFDYGAMVAMKMARKGFPSRVAVIDLKQTVKKNINPKDDKLYDYLIEFILDVLLAGTFNEVNADPKTKDRILRAVNVEVTLENKVKAIAGEIQRVLGNDKIKTEEVEEVIAGSLRRAHAMFEYDNKMSQNKEKLTNRLIGKLAKAQGRFLVIKDRNSSGLLTNYLGNDIVKNLTVDSPINLQQEILNLNTSADSLNKFFSTKAY